MTEIGESAFADCNNLQKVVFGSPLTKVYGNSEYTGIFYGCNAMNMISLVLSGEQKLMNGKEVDGKYVWTPGSLDYKNCSDFQNCYFLGYKFSSVTCGDKTYPEY